MTSSESSERPIRREAGDEGISAVEHVYRLTRAAILRGEYAPGSPLRMQDLAERSGVSAIPVREALRRLEAERLVESVANKGARVAELSFPDLADAYRLRTILEVEAVRLCLPNLTDDDLEQARRLKDGMTRLLAEGAADEGHEAHRRLHFLFYEKAGSTWLLHVIGTIWDHTERYRRLALQWGADPEDLGRQHGEMLDSLGDRDLDGAIEAVRRHFEGPIRAIEQRVRLEQRRTTGPDR
ncbi:MAG: GntR family transcriptional regulator [Actinomycetota bacterium]